MTCHDVREQLSALLDEALSVAERSALEAHLATCAECRRELEQLRGTVALLGRLGPAHAPAGFVDRVVSEAYRPSRFRRFFDALFRPLRVKLPLEVAAVVLVGLSALYVYERTPEVRPLARPEMPVPPPSAAAPAPAAGTVGETSELRAKVAPAEPDSARQETAPAPPPVVTSPAPSSAPAPSSNELGGPGASGSAKPAPLTDQRSGASSATQAETTKPGTKDAKKEAEAKPRRDAAGAPPAPAAVEKLAKAAEPAPSRDALTVRSAPEPSPAAAAPPSSAGAAAPGARGSVGGPAAPAPAAPAHEGANGDAAAQKSRTAVARLMRAADASGRLVVPRAEPAEIALDALLSRLGATRVARRVDQTSGPILVDVNVPVARYHDLLEGLGRIGRWTIERESKTLPLLDIRLEVAITVEP
jgi:anti-sigma factor RsiW